MMINNLKNLLDLYEVDSEDALIRQFYKSTSCGAWLVVNEKGITFGSIVEGSDAEVEAEEMCFPFSEADLVNAIEFMENEADRLWREANENEKGGDE